MEKVKYMNLRILRTAKRNFQMPCVFFGSVVTEWNAQDFGRSKAAKDTSMHPSQIDMTKASQETGGEANIGFVYALTPS